MSAIRRPRVKVQANLGSKRKATEEKKTIKDEEEDTFIRPLATINNNINNNDIASNNNILQKDLQSTITEPLDLKPVASYKTKSDLHIQIPPRVRTESSSSSHSIPRIRTESVSSNYSDSHGLSRKSKMIRDVSNKDRSELTMFDLIYNYTPTANPMVKSEPGAMRPPPPPPPIKTEQTQQPPAPPEEEDSSEAPILVPQLKIGMNGEVIIDEQSLEIQTTAEKEAKKVLSNSSCIFMDEFTGSNGFYKKQKRTREWAESETIKFYKCLHTVGTDFTLMMTLFPNRNRRDLKLKFKREEKINENLIKKALLYPKAFDIMELERVLAADEAEKQRREEEWNEIKKKKAASRKQKVPKTKKTSKEGIQLTDGEKAYKNEGVLTENIRKKVKVEKSCSKKVDDMLSEFVPEEDDTQSSSVMEVDVSDLKSEYVREITDFKQEMLDDNCETHYTTELKEGDEILGEYVPEEEVNQNGVKSPTMKEEGVSNLEDVSVPLTQEPSHQSTLEQENVHESTLPNDESFEEEEEDLESPSYEGIEEPFDEDEHINDQDDAIDDMTAEELIACVANGSLAVVTSESEDGETVYEVYKMCPNSGELSENPLNLHPEIINVIKMVV